MTKSNPSKDSIGSSRKEDKLVSIICRTVGRLELQQALNSVCDQTYSNIEVILVDAIGGGIADYEQLCSGRAVKLISEGRRLSRPKAANAGLLAAAGDYVLFLDDDDWIDPEHISNLASLLEHKSNLKSNKQVARAAYCNTQKVDSSGKLLDHVFRHDFDPSLLKRDNFIPIHSMLFASSLLTDGCRFDESLDIYEDWDFWLQVAQFTPVLHLDQLTAFYREGGDSETAVADENAKYTRDHPNALARERVLAKWLPTWTATDINMMLGSMDQSAAIGEFQENLNAAHDVIHAREQELRQLTESATDLGEQLTQLNTEHGALAAGYSVLENSHMALSGKHQQLNKNHQQLAFDLEQLVHSHENLTAIKDQLTVSHDQLTVSHDQLTVSHDQLAVQHRELDRGVQRILNSYSWRMTKPFRYLGRRASQYIISPLFSPIKKGLVRLLLKNPKLHKSVQEVRSNRPAKPTDISEPDKFHYGLDSPNSEHSLFSDSLLLRGWALSESGPVSITAFIDEMEYRAFTPNLDRPDVAGIFTQLPHAGDCGFWEKIPLDYFSSGPHQLTLLVTSPSGLREEIKQQFTLLKGDALYQAWFSYTLENDSRNTPGIVQESTNSQEMTVHILLTGYNSIEMTVKSLTSIAAQTWKNWRVHYRGSHWQEIESILAEQKLLEIIERSDQIHDHSQLLHTCDMGNDFLLGLDAGEQLLPHALTELLTLAEIHNSDAVYSDHDIVNEAGDHSNPVFTFSWSPDHLMSRNYVADVYLVRLSKLPKEHFLQHQGPNWRYALLLESGHSRNRIDRVAKILWSASLIGAQASKQGLIDEHTELENYLQRNELAESVTSSDGFRHVDWPLGDEPLVSIIIPTMGKLELIRPCLDSLVEVTQYSNYEVLILDNSRGHYPEGIEYLAEKNFTIIECDEEFNWARLNNIGASHANGEFYLFLNDDIEIIDGGWLLELTKQASRPDVGAVGGLLLYPNGAIQHAGVFLVNHGGGCSHLFHKMMPDAKIYRRLDKTTREVSANTGACLMVSKEKFESLNGFNEKLAIVGNDIDFCLRLLAQNYRNIWTPHCRLIHHESISRSSTMPKEDEHLMWDLWGNQIESGDNYYNPNLTLFKWDCSLYIDVTTQQLISGSTLPEEAPSNRQEYVAREGVNLIAYIRAEMGVGEGARSDARALDAASIDFGIINFETGNPSRMTDLSWQHKEILSPDFDINLIHINADFLPMAIKELPSHFFTKRYNIAYWAWELEEIPAEWMPAFEEVDEVWVPSDFVKAAVEKCSPVPVVTIPHCVDVRVEETFLRQQFGLPEDSFIFLSMFDTHSIAERKNPYGAIKAFKQAFAKDDKTVCLILKANNSSGSSIEKLRGAIKSYPNILILDGTHSRKEINGLLSLIDCYVSLHRSEGFGLGPAEAMCLGKATIITNWSGSTEYTSADNCKAIDYKLVKIGQDLGPYKADQRWADPNIEQAAAAMKELAGNPALVDSIGKNARLTIEKLFSPAAIGKQMASRLNFIRKKLITGE